MSTPEPLGEDRWPATGVDLETRRRRGHRLVHFTEILGGQVVFAIEAMGTRVAAVQLTTGPPLVLLADHVEGEGPILVYRWPT